jgi:hypothetical protein
MRYRWCGRVPGNGKAYAIYPMSLLLSVSSVNGRRATVSVMIRTPHTIVPNAQRNSEDRIGNHEI